MKVGIVDVGSNTVRLLVARRQRGRLVTLREEREHLFLGRDVERDGSLSTARIEEAARCAEDYTRIARALGARAVDVIVTAPGRQSANGDELVRRLASATAAPVQVLTADEEGRLAFAGATAAAVSLPATVAVCDVGGGSAEAVVGTLEGGPAWSRSLDIGAVRLTERFLVDDPPDARALVAARVEVERHLEGFAPPLPHAALATGGTARGLRKLVGSELEAAELEAALRILCKRPSAKVAKTFGLHEQRARTLAAGAVILSCLQSRLGVPLKVSRAGLREGAALALLHELAATAA
jgi:exopolyphosphatase / guanosine-5'-triphosphate,3'-diphosphate pyrophosphatase